MQSVPPGRPIDDLRFHGDWAADSFLAGGEYLEYRHASSRAHIVGSAHARLHGFDGWLVHLGETSV